VASYRGGNDSTVRMELRQTKGGLDSPVATVDLALAAPSITAPSEHAQTGTLRPRFTGLGVKGATVTLRIASTDYGTTTVTGTGTWELTPDEGLPSGERTVTAEQSLRGLSSIRDHELFIGILPPEVEVAGIRHRYSDHQLEYHFRGTGLPGATVQYRRPGGNWSDPPSTVVDENGEWSQASYRGGNSGTVRMELRQTKDDLVSPVRTVDLTLAAPSITTPAGNTVPGPRPEFAGEGVKGSEVTLWVDGIEYGATTVTGTGTWTMAPAQDLPGGLRAVSVVQTLRGLTSPAAARQVTVTNVFGLQQPADGSRTGPQPVFTGTGRPGAQVIFTVDGRGYAPVPVGADGNWTWSLKSAGAWIDWTPGEHR
ncbi:hypothetical protein, partial [Streptomyces lavendulae]|uniref:hypothetical protein n=1 Tax=Streptomyces lavendulae TaxID=1914 RepID=UPI0036E10D16